MPEANNSDRLKTTATRTDFREARPLLQAIALGLTLAVALTVAAALANPDGAKHQQLDRIEYTPGPGVHQSPGTAAQPTGPTASP
ncbi:hypothetical protein E1180_01305 [Roseibium denhamense]|uniref:Uncharacterized protein n=1 Tax=Roseibium denhamense TaxID=76305 RepID=A0ABY1NE27_9HYPH|nr:hypothetical protein [Roseibium denhamense]MTI04154.1 hypothetical protein [Roseibium denhamense]SMP07458.1 hypothetical protein SAMN06265374_0871 [Roseibium denhamense]